MKIERFWMVAGDGPSNVRHESKELAEIEAKRLARLHPEHWFFVVEAISAHCKSDVRTVRFIGRGEPVDDIPF